MRRFSAANLISCCLAVLLLLSALGPGAAPSAFAAGEPETGSCGERVSYTLYPDGQLIISGAGGTYDYLMGGDCISPPPFFRKNITSVVVESGVSSIGNYLFYHKDGIKSVTLPRGLSTIGASAFEGCAALESVTLPGGLREIGHSAFAGCVSLREIGIPSSVSSVGYNAFLDCAGLKKLSIQGNASLDGFVFQGCRGLESITVTEDNDHVAASGNCLIDTATKTLLTGCRNSVIPADGSVTAIGDYAFAGCEGLKKLVIPEGVLSIGRAAFYRCADLTDLTIPQSAREIGAWAFFECPGYAAKTETLFSGYCGEYYRDDFSPEKQTMMRWTLDSDGTLTISGKGKMADYMPGVPIVIVPPWTEEAAYIRRVVLEDGVESIGDYAFYRCTGITSVSIPATVTVLGSDLFPDEAPITSLTVSKENPVFYSAGNCLMETKTDQLVLGCASSVIPEGVTGIRSEAFSGCGGLRSIVFPASVKSIGPYAFAYCDGLTEVTVPQTVEWIGNDAFFRCKGLTAVTIAGSGTSVGGSAFEDCENLKDIALPEDIMEVKGRAFDGTRWLADLPDGVVYLGNVLYAYKGDMPEGTRIAVAPGTKTIAANAFYGCEGLLSVSVSDSVESIGYGAFEECVNLAAVELPENLTFVGQDAFRRTRWLEDRPDGPLYLGKVLYGFRGDMPRGTALTVRPGTVSIAQSAFSGCDGLTALSLPDSLQRIGSYAFYDCENLQEIRIPDGVETIDPVAFGGCVSARTLRIGKGLRSLGAEAFNELPALGSIEVSEENPYFTGSGNCLVRKQDGMLLLGCRSSVIPDDGTVKGIGSGAFYHCAGLTELSLPDGVTEIKEYAFDECAGLAWLDIPASVTAIGYGLSANHYDFVMPETTVMRVRAGSYAEQWAMERGQPYEVTGASAIPGDVDGDGEVTSGDARLTLRAAVGLENYAPGTRQFAAADVDRSGAIEPADARSVLRASVKLEELA